MARWTFTWDVSNLSNFYTVVRCECTTSRNRNRLYSIIITILFTLSNGRKRYGFWILCTHLLTIHFKYESNDKFSIYYVILRNITIIIKIFRFPYTPIRPRLYLKKKKITNVILHRFRDISFRSSIVSTALSSSEV